MPSVLRVRPACVVYLCVMKLHSWIMLLGILVYCVPFLGVPAQVRGYVLFALGFCIVVAGFVVRARARAMLPPSDDITYVETYPKDTEHGHI